MYSKLYLSLAALALSAGLCLASPAQADWNGGHHNGGHHNYNNHYNGHGHGYRHGHNNVWLSYNDYYPDYYYAPRYYPPRPVYYDPPRPYYGYGYAPPPAYFMGIPLYGLGLNVNIH